MKQIKGFVVSIWNNGDITETIASLNKQTGKVSVSVNNNIIYDNDIVNEEYFESKDGNIRYKICPICREFILKQIKNGLIVETKCTNGCI